jgi:hypothetical protein
MEQTVQIFNGAENKILGTWDYNAGLVTLKPCLEVKVALPSQEISACISAVEITLLGRVEISTDSQHGIGYEKSN